MVNLNWIYFANKKNCEKSHTVSSQSYRKSKLGDKISVVSAAFFQRILLKRAPYSMRANAHRVKLSSLFVKTSVIFISVFLSFLNWSIIALQCCVTFCCKSVIGIHVSCFFISVKTSGFTIKSVLLQF